MPRLRTGSASLGKAPTGFSLTWLLFSSVVLVMVLVFATVQLLGVIPGDAPLPLRERLSVMKLVQEVSANLPLFLIWIGLMMAGIMVALRLGMRSLRKISDRAAEIGPETISQRLPLHDTPKEIAPLVLAFNAALDRLEDGIRQQREFSANAAHELRTPLATLRTQLENALEPGERSGAIEECDRLSRLIAQLLALAEAEAVGSPGGDTFDVVHLSRELCRDMASGIVADGRSIAFETAHHCYDWRGMPGLVEVALRNLVENAARHTARGSHIAVAIDERGRLIVSDTGGGVPAEFVNRLFQRFSKVNAHGRGAGLGLSIANRIMTVHGGGVTLEPSATGARFVLDQTGRGGMAA